MTDEWKPHAGQKIETLYAWIAEEEDGGEGVIAAHLDGHGWMPLIGADKASIESCRYIAMNAVNESGRPARLVQFSTLTVIDVVAP